MPSPQTASPRTPAPAAPAPAPAPVLAPALADDAAAASPTPPRAGRKQQTRQALMDAAHALMDAGTGFCALSLREVARTAGVVPTAFYRHFADMDALGLALVDEVGQTFRAAIREVRRHEFEKGGAIPGSVRIFLDAVERHRSQFVFLAREQFGGSATVRQALRQLRRQCADDMVADLKAMAQLTHLRTEDLDEIADLVVKTVFATLPDMMDPQPADLPEHLRPQTKMVQQLRFIMIGAKRWKGMRGAFLAQRDGAGARAALRRR